MIQTILFHFQARCPIATAVQTGIAQGRCVLVSRPLRGPGKRHDRLYCQPLQRFYCVCDAARRGFRGPLRLFCKWARL